MRRHRDRWWLSTVVAGLVLVSPLESGLLPGRVGGLLAERAAAAQSDPVRVLGVRVLGEPDDCPAAKVGPASEDWVVDRSDSPWTPVDLSVWLEDDAPSKQPDSKSRSDCLLELPACPESKVFAGRLMRLSVPTSDSRTRFADYFTEWASVPDLSLYPEFCEDRMAHAADTGRACRDAVGVVVEDFNHGGELWCRLLHPLECPEGMHRSGLQRCRSVQRRGWTCKDGYMPANEFNHCYKLAAAPAPGQVHPACGPGSPKFPLGPSAHHVRQNPNASGTPAQRACAEYAGRDYLPDPIELKCTEFKIDMSDGTSTNLVVNTSSEDSNLHWCRYDTKLLNVGCHLSPPDPQCAGSDVFALCLKRASHTGGCDLTVHTIRCRNRQAAFSQSRLTDQQARDAGCEPCPTLPFEAPRAPCPTYRSKRPTSNNIDHYARILEQKRDFAVGNAKCGSGIRDPDPARDSDPATKTWQERAKSPECRSVAVCADPPSGRVEWSSSHRSGLAVVNSTVLFHIADIPLRAGYEPMVGYDPRPREGTLTVFDQSPSHQYYADAAGQDGRVRTLTRPDDTKSYSNVGRFDGLVDSECTVRQQPRFNIVIEELWPDPDADPSTDPKTEQIEKMFGDQTLDWWRALPDATARRDRTAARGPLVDEEIECAHNNHRTCAWTPDRPGYYRVLGAGAWLTSRAGNRTWALADPRYDDRLNNHLSDQVNRDNLAALVARLGLTPAKVGLKADHSGLKPAIEPDQDCVTVQSQPMHCDSNWLHTTEALTKTKTGCRPIDLRIICGSSYNSGNYTETVPIGVIVHEIRTRTVAAVTHN